MRRIALVGDIGSGKTFFSKLFRYPVFNADLVVSNLYQKDKFLFKKIKKKFPNKVSNFPLKKVELLKIIFQKQKGKRYYKLIIMFGSQPQPYICMKKTELELVRNGILMVNWLWR